MGEAGLRREERELLQRQSADMQRQLDAIDARMQRAELQEAERRQLQRAAAALRAQQRSAQLQLDRDGAAGAAAPLPTCPASCTAGHTPPSSNGCGNDFTGKFHSWAMTAMQEATGCYTVPLVGLLNDFTGCCDKHDVCYGTCGTTQAFCDTQLGSCMEAQATLPGCDTVIGGTALTVQLLGCSHFTDAQDESVAASCQSTDAHHGCVAPCYERGGCLETAGQVRGRFPYPAYSSHGGQS